MEVLEQQTAVKYLNVRHRTVGLCEPLKIEDYVVQPVEFISPSKWHLAHTTWFFEEFLLKKHLPDYEIFHPMYSFFFNSYYVQVGERAERNKRGDYTRPTVEEIYNYRGHVDTNMERLLNSGFDFPEVVLRIGLSHEEQHQELLLTDLKYVFGLNPLYPYYNDIGENKDASGSGDWLNTPEGMYNIGYDGTAFHFDNEKQCHRVFLEDYALRGRLVTNAEYLEFIRDRGYEDVRLWHSEAWTWLHEENINSPLYWKNGKQYFLHGFEAVNPEAPVTHISYYEAFAFANWAGYRLPTEFEWEASAEKFNYGNRWEWTSSAYQPYPGYKKYKGALGEYNGKFMVNQKVLRGSSLVTAPGHRRKTYRNFFHPHLQWQFTGIRLAR